MSDFTLCTLLLEILKDMYHVKISNGKLSDSGSEILIDYVCLINLMQTILNINRHFDST